MSLSKKKHPDKSDFPEDFQNYFEKKPVQLSGFPSRISESCILVPTSVIDSKNSPFVSKDKKKVDEIHHCETMGLIEEKSTNYSSSMLDSKFSDHKEFIEEKYSNYETCKVGYCVLKAERLSEKLQRELKVNQSKELYFSYNKNNKKFTIKDCPVYFVRKT